MSSTTVAPTVAPTVAATTKTTTTATTTTTDDSAAAFSAFFLLFLGIFVIVSIYCLVKSLICFGKSGSTGEKIFGVIIAFFTGPFYLLYLNFNEGYCKDEETPVAPATPMVGGRKKH